MNRVNLEESFRVAFFERKTSMAELAKKCGKSHQYLSNRVTGKLKNQISVKVLDEVVSHLDYSLGAFIMLGEKSEI